MPTSTPPKKTSRFVDRSRLVNLIALGMIIAAGIISLSEKKTLISQTVTILPGESIRLDPIELKPRLIGALRVDVTASITANRWVTYEVMLLDGENNTIGSALKQAWKESGTWQEDGESGTWQKQDLRGGIDIRAQKAEPVTIAISVLGHGNTAGTAINEAVTFRVKAQDGVIDGRYLWLGFIAVLLFWMLSSIAAGQSGKTVIDKAVHHRVVLGRAVMGGNNSLIQVSIKTKTDKRSPPQFKVNLYLRDGKGEQLYFRGFPLNRQTSEENIYRQTLTVYFVLERRASYGFYVEVTPDDPVDHIYLSVKEKVKTRQAVDVITISSS